MKFSAALILLFVFANSWSQDLRKPLRGKVAAGADLKEVFVINSNTNDAVSVEARGYFTILAAAGDTLQFSSTRFRARQRLVKPEDFDGDLMLVELEPMIQLDEVVVQRYDHINAVSLGILEKEAKKYTPAERHLKTAGELKPQSFLGLLGGNMPTDPIINAISGRTAMLKKAVQVEKKESMLKQIQSLFDETFFTGNLKIPTIYVQGFLYYLVENDSFTRLLPERNKIALSFLMTQLAQTYKQTLNLEKE